MLSIPKSYPVCGEVGSLETSVLPCSGLITSVSANATEARLNTNASANTTAKNFFITIPS